MRSYWWLLIVGVLALSGCGAGGSQAAPALPWQTPITADNADQLALVSTFDTGRDFLDGLLFLPDRPLVLAGSQTAITQLGGMDRMGIVIHDLATGEQIGAVEGRGFKLLATDDPNVVVDVGGGDDGALGVVNLDSGEAATLDFDRRLLPINDAATSPDGQTVAAGGDGAIVVMNLKTGEVSLILPHPGEVTAVAYHPDGTQIASGMGDGTVRLWKVDDASEPVALWQAVGQPIYRLAFSPDGSRLAAVSGKTITLWQLDGDHPPALAATLEGHTDQARGLAFSPDGSLIVTGGKEGRALVWSVDGTLLAELVAERLGQFEPVWVNGVAFNAQGTLIGMAVADGTIRLWAVGP